MKKKWTSPKLEARGDVSVITQITKVPGIGDFITYVNPDTGQSIIGPTTGERLAS